MKLGLFILTFIFSSIGHAQNMFASNSAAMTFSQLECAKEEQATTKIDIPRLRAGIDITASKKGTEESAKIIQAEAKCQSRSNFARKMCLTCTNPDISRAATAIGAVTAGLDLSGSQKESCKKFGSAMDIAKGAVAAYNTACGGARLACGMSCDGLNAQVEKSIAELETYAAAMKKCVIAKRAKAASIRSSTLGGGEAAAAALDAEADTCQSEQMAARIDINGVRKYQAIAVQPTLTTCDTYKMKLATGAAGLMNIVMSAKGAENCSNNLATTDPIGSDVDCSKPENEKAIDCICRKDPTLTGCPGGGAGLANNPYMNLTGGDAYTNAQSESSSSNLDLSGSGVDASGALGGLDSSAGGLGGFPGSGGGAGGISASGTGKAADGSGAGTGKPLNKNILSGYEGGSGGGAGGGGYADNGYADQFKPFMPGGDKDPTRNPANALFAGGQVTGNSGKSNWEKVRERYHANQPSLIVGGP